MRRPAPAVRLLLGVILVFTPACREAPPAGSVTGAGSPLRSLPRGSLPVVSVVDGDTIHVLRRGRDITVRLIGIDAPEVGWYGGKAECYGAQAGRFARSLMAEARVTLELDEERLDPYERLLAYVYLDDDRMANVVLVRRGFATVTIYPPNDRYEERLLAAEDAARADGAGLWSVCRSG